MIRFFRLQISEWNFLLFVGDVSVYILSVIISFSYLSHYGGLNWLFLQQDTFLIALVGLTYIVVLYVANLYDYYQDFRIRQNFSRVILSSLIGTFVVALFFYYLFGHYLSRNFIEWQGLSFAWLLALWRYSFSAIALPVRLQRKVLIVGAGKTGRRILNTINRLPNSGLAVVGFIDDDPQKIGATVAGVPVLGRSCDLQEIIETHKAGLVVVAITHEKSPELLSSLTRLSFHGCQLIDMPSIYEFLTGRIPIDHISDIWLFLNSLNTSKLYYRHAKRVIDVALTLVGLVITIPFFLLIPLAIKLDSEGPVFYTQERLGQNARPFKIIKFRTMIQHAERAGPQWASHNDPRITRVGRILRKLRLDELPQLFNILKGEMGMIGPRPEREVFIQEFKEKIPDLRPGRRAGDPPGADVVCGYRERLPYYSYRLLVKPGVTGWAQVMYPYAASMEDTKEKLQYDLYYIKNMSLFLDLAIILKTIRIVLFGHGR